MGPQHIWLLLQRLAGQQFRELRCAYERGVSPEEYDATVARHIVEYDELERNLNALYGNPA